MPDQAAAQTTSMFGGGDCVDVSNWQGSVLPVDEWRAAGVRYAVVGCQFPQIARGHVRQFRAGGVEVIALYQFNYWSGLGGSSPEAGTLGEMHKALEVADSEDVRLIFADCESYSGEVATTADHKLRLLDIVVNAALDFGCSVGMYTSSGWWRGAVNDTRDYAHLPLWRAGYFYSGAIVEDAGFGGWSRCVIHQYSSTGSRNDSAPDGKTPPLCGVSVDYNKVHQSFWELATMADVRVDEVLKALTGLAGPAAMDRLRAWNYSENGAARGNSLLDGYVEARLQIAQASAAISALEATGDGRHLLDADMRAALLKIAQGATALAEAEG